MNTELSLRDKDVYPSEEILQNALGKKYSTYKELIDKVSDPGCGLAHEWRYYRDGGWLCKVTFKKKTIFWLSLREKSFQVRFYILAKNRDGVSDLPIGEKGKHVPLKIQVSNKKQIKDVLEIAKYQKAVK